MPTEFFCRLLGGVSMDFAAIPADFDTAEEALRIADAVDGAAGQAPAAVVELIDELYRIDAMGEDDGFLSIDPAGTSLGVILCTRWPEWIRTIYTLLQLTKDRELALVDLQRLQVFDPRGRVEVDVEIAVGTRLPYLSEQIVIDVMARQDYYGDYLIATQREGTYAQTLFEQGRLCEVEYREGSPDRHFQTVTPDRSLVPRLISAWLHHGPQADLLQAQQWERLQF